MLASGAGDGVHRDDESGIRGQGRRPRSQLLLQLKDHAFQLPLLPLVLRRGFLQLQQQPPILRLQVLQL